MTPSAPTERTVAIHDELCEFAPERLLDAVSTLNEAEVRAVLVEMTRTVQILAVEHPCCDPRQLNRGTPPPEVPYPVGTRVHHVVTLNPGTVLRTWTEAHEVYGDLGGPWCEVRFDDELVTEVPAKRLAAL